jgi:hypothetical protein
MIEENFSGVIAALQVRINHGPHPEEPERSEGVSKDGGRHDCVCDRRNDSNFGDAAFSRSMIFSENRYPLFGIML